MLKEKKTVEEQKVYLDFLLSSNNLYGRVQNIFNPLNFDKSLQKVAKFIQTHVQQHNTLPTFQQVNAVSQINDFQKIDNILQGHEEWLLDEFEQFTKREELERAILKSADLLGKGDYDPVETLIKNAVQISLTRDLGIDYFSGPKERLLRLKSSNGQISTGWKEVDDLLYGGVNRGELQIFCGAPGTGKSLFLQNLSLNWMKMGLNGIYITFELSQDLTAMRIDSMVTGICSRDIFKNLDDLEIKIALESKKAGRLKIKYMSAQSSVNQVKAYIKELAIQKNFVPDFICLDYLDLIVPSSSKIDISNLFIKDKLVCEELRNFAIEQKFLMATASQLNRNSYDEIEFTGSSIAGGISKLQTCDNLFGIYTSRSLKERGAIQLQFMKTRNSAGVGNKIDLNFDVNSLRITDSNTSTTEKIESGSDILAKIRSNSSANIVQNNSSENHAENKKDILKSLLDSIKKDS